MKRGASEALFTPDVCREIFRYLPDVQDKLRLAATCRSTHAASQDPVCWQSCDLGDSADNLSTLRLLAQRTSSVQQLSGATKQHTKQWQGAWSCFTTLQELRWSTNSGEFCAAGWDAMASCLPKSIKRASLTLALVLPPANDSGVFPIVCLCVHGFAPVLTHLAIVSNNPPLASDGEVFFAASQDFSMLEKLQISASAISSSLSASRLTTIDLKLNTSSLYWDDHFSEIKTLVHIRVELLNEQYTYLWFDECPADVFRNVQSISLKADSIREVHSFSGFCEDRLRKLEFQVTLLEDTCWNLDHLQEGDGFNWRHRMWNKILTISATARNTSLHI